jgi:hypothetical protein
VATKAADSKPHPVPAVGGDQDFLNLAAQTTNMMPIRNINPEAAKTKAGLRTPVKPAVKRSAAPTNASAGGQRSWVPNLRLAAASVSGVRSTRVSRVFRLTVKRYQANPANQPTTQITMTGHHPRGSAIPRKMTPKAKR